MTKKFLLINPPYPMEESPSPPFGLMSLAAYLNKHNIEVLIEDFVVSPYTYDYIARIIKDFKPDIIGATAVTMNINSALHILRDCRDIYPSGATVLGGPHATFDAHNLLIHNPFLDCIVRGEGELTAVELVGSMGKKETWGTIDGLSYRNSGEIKHNKDRDFIQYLDSLPYPARHLCNLNKYRALDLPIGMMTSRGCPHSCIFCVGSKMVGKKVRYFSVERVVNEFQMLSEMGFPQINIVDDLFTSHKKRCIEICNEMINRNIKTKWTAFARVDTIDRDLLLTLKEAGCTALCFGIESGNQEILDTVKKKTTLEMCRNAVAMCRDAGILPLASYILGLPGETAETIKKTMEFAGTLNAQYGYHILAPFPGTEVREKSSEYGIRILHDEWDKYDANQSVCETANLSGKDVDDIYIKFNEGIEKYIERVVEEYIKGTRMSEEMNAIAVRKISRTIAWLLIETEGKIILQSENSEPSDVIEKLAGYLLPHTKLSDHIIREKIRDFFDKGYIFLNENHGFSWSSLN